MKTKYLTLKMVFISGVGRTGTGILRRALSRHNNILILKNNLRFFIDPDGIIPFCKILSSNWTPYQFDQSIKRLEKVLKGFSRKNKIIFNIQNIIRAVGLDKFSNYKIFPRYSNFDLVSLCPKYPQLVDNLIDQLKLFDFKGEWEGMPLLKKKTLYFGHPKKEKKITKLFSDFIINVLSNTKTKKDVRCFVDANIWNHLWFNEIVKFFPKAKLIHIQRNPMDVVASLMHQNWSPKDVEQAAKFYRAIMQEWWKVKLTIPRNAYMEIKLEQLTSKPEETFKDILNFTSLPFDKKVLGEDLSKSNHGRWKKDIPKKSITNVKKILRLCLDKQGYK